MNGPFRRLPSQRRAATRSARLERQFEFRIIPVANADGIKLHTIDMLLQQMLKGEKKLLFLLINLQNKLPVLLIKVQYRLLLQIMKVQHNLLLLMIKV